MARITFQPGFHINPFPGPVSPLGTLRLDTNSRPPEVVHDPGITFSPYPFPINPIGVFKITD